MSQALNFVYLIRAALISIASTENMYILQEIGTSHTLQSMGRMQALILGLLYKLDGLQILQPHAAHEYPLPESRSCKPWKGPSFPSMEQPSLLGPSESHGGERCLKGLSSSVFVCEKEKPWYYYFEGFEVVQIKLGLTLRSQFA